MRIFKIGFLPVLSVIVLNFMAGSLFAQSNPSFEKDSFLILVQTTDEGIKLTGKKGCAFEELSFSIPDNKPQAINQNGMLTIADKSFEKVKASSDFLFMIKKTRDGLAFRGLKGTAWKTLSFDCTGKYCHQLINPSGMVLAE